MNIKLCEDCENLICKNGKMLCHEMWDKPCEELEECPEGFTMEEVVELEEKTKGQRVDHGIAQEKRKDSKPGKHLMSVLSGKGRPADHQ